MKERGAATILALALVAGLALVTVGLAAVGRVVAARAQASAAADAAALAAAPVTFAPFGAAGSPGQEAERFARDNGARLISCRCPIDLSLAARTVSVVVELTVDLPLFGRHQLRAAAAAEFAPLDLLGAT